MGETIRRQIKEIGDAEKKYHSIFENAMEGIFQVHQGRYLSVNTAFVKIFGYGSPDELVTRISDIAYQTYANPDERIKFQKTIDENGFIERFETERYRKDRPEYGFQSMHELSVIRMGKFSIMKGLLKISPAQT